MDYTPLTRYEKYLNAIRTGDTTNLPQPINREEAYLYSIAMNSGGGGDTDAVKYTAQTLTAEQQAQARENIGAADAGDVPTDAVKYTAQTLTNAQKTQARTNIGVVQSDWNAYRSEEPDFIKNKPPIINSTGTGGNLNGGTGMNNVNETAKQNSIAYGYIVSAKGDYSAAFGYFLQALHDYEIAYGKFNLSSADTAFSIGNGTSTSDRHNLMELKTDGRMFLNGNAVKTEGGDDNKLRLGQIWGMKFYSNSTEPARRAPRLGFSFLFSSSISSITFQSGQSSVAGNVDVYQFGDFVGFISSNAVKVQPIEGRKVGFPATGQWIKVENCYYMFYVCRGITSLDLSMFDTSEVENMGHMFYNCEALTSLDLSNFDTSKVQNMINMFNGCTALGNLDLSSFDLTNVTSYGSMFNNAGITTLKTPKINPHDDIPLPRTLYSQDGTAYTTLPVTTGTSIELRQSWT